MRRVRSSGNKSTELKMLDLLLENRISGWKRNYPVKGHPDFVFLKGKLAIFIDGCFWHGHGCRNIHPKENIEYWDRKLKRNKQHDSEITKKFQIRGWTVLRIWECELKKKNLGSVVNKIQDGLKPKKRQ